MALVPLGATWRQAWDDRGFRWRLLLTLPALGATLGALARFVRRVEERPGVVLPDPLLELVSPRDLTWLAFALIYAAILSGLVLLARRPRRLVQALQAYAVMAWVRMAVMWVTPLDPPPRMILLEDPLVQGLGRSRATSSSAATPPRCSSCSWPSRAGGPGPSSSPAPPPWEPRCSPSTCTTRWTSSPRRSSPTGRGAWPAGSGPATTRMVNEDPAKGEQPAPM